MAGSFISRDEIRIFSGVLEGIAREGLDDAPPTQGGRALRQ